LLNSYSSHVPNYSTYSFGEAKPNEVLNYSVLIAPVGIGNLTIGYNEEPGSSVPLAPGVNESVTSTIHLLVKNPANQTLIEQDIVTPSSFQINFNQRGEYTVYITNKGIETTSIPMGLIFSQTNGNANRETDKFTLSIVFTVFGLVLVCVSLIMTLISKRHTELLKKR
jgi:hypothetical protein